MAHIVVMPKLGLTMTEGTIVKWMKSEGEEVQAGEGLFEVATDKLVNEVEANKSGVLRKIIIPEGDIVECLKQIAIIADLDEDISSILKETGASGEVDTPVQVDPKVKQIIVNEESKTRVKAAPVAKKLATESGINLQLVTGTGHGGRIVLKDVEDYIENEKNNTKVSPVAAKLAQELNVNVSEINKDGRVMKEDVLAFESKGTDITIEEKRVKMTPMRKVIASRMHESWIVSPAVTYDIKVDTTNLKRVKDSLKDVCKLTYTDLLVKIMSTALLEFPLVNCSVDKEEFIIKNYINIGVAVAVEGGLVVPVIKNVQSKGLSEISESVKDLASKAKAGKLIEEEMSGGTFTITNLGMYGIQSFSPIINQPEVAILGVNTIEDTPVVINGEIVIKPLMNLSLTADHRAIDGAMAAKFLSKVKKLIEKPEILIL
ncbi:dihydrolipoamide acetyltransferase family protein [Clostridium sp.]|uniref:dihydrolipoamide acetyltransferase family protein n=1 Tax=Clostridium sp. TaxID=1506 RepID=UPI003F4B1F41